MSDGMSTRDQQRARMAYESVTQVEEKKDWTAGFGRQCLRLPSLIHECGLCQTVAFLEAKAKGNTETYYYQVLSALVRTSNLDDSVPEFAGRVRSAGMKEYQWMTRESMICAQWLKRYAEAILKVDPMERND